MKVFVINLDKDKERMASIDAQLNKLGVPYKRVQGVYAKEMPEEVKWKSVSRFRWWCAVGRPIVPAEIGVALSHASIYKSMKQDEAVCIFEDDVIIKEDFPKRLSEVEKAVDVTKPQVYLFSDHRRHFSGRDGIVRDEDGICADGYVITKKAADWVLGNNFPMKVPCDHWFRWAKMGGIELFHVLPASVRQNQVRFGTSTQANADDVSKYPPLKWCLHKAKRLVGKTIDWVLIKVGL